MAASGALWSHYTVLLGLEPGKLPLPSKHLAFEDANKDLIHVTHVRDTAIGVRNNPGEASQKLARAIIAGPNLVKGAPSSETVFSTAVQASTDISSAAVFHLPPAPCSALQRTI